MERVYGLKVSSKILLLGVGAAVAGITAAGAAALGSTQYLMRVALDRQMPPLPNMEKTRNQLCGGAMAETFFQKLSAAAEKLETTPHTTVQMQSYDGQTLVGHWFDCKEPKRVIVAMHGWRSGWSSDFGIIADFWRRNDSSVLFAEQRGQGSSGGAYMGFGMMERHDCLCWCRWINSHTAGHIPIYLAGVSMGATTVLMASDLELPSNVRGIMADCGFTSAHDIWKHVAEKNLHLSYDIHRGMADVLCRKRIAMSSRDCSTEKSLKDCKIPVLLIHGTADRFVPVEMTYRNYQACAAPKYLLIVPGAEHGMSYFLEKDRYEQAVLNFWKVCESN